MQPDERLKKLTSLLREVLVVVGEDPEREGLLRTPERWAEALLFYTQGAVQDPADHLKIIFQSKDEYQLTSDDMIIQDNIEFTSMCEHHVAPIRGVAHIAYIPNPQSRTITGLSKLSRVVEVFSRRLQVQEWMTQQIAQAIDEHLEPEGVLVVVQAVHYCTIQRGVEQRHTSTLTTARRGVFLDNPELEVKFQEYLRLQMDTRRM